MIGITDGYLSLLQDSGEVREDLKIPEGDLGKEIESKYEAAEEILVNAFDYALPSTTHLFVGALMFVWWINGFFFACVFQISVLSAMNEEAAVAIKAMTK